VHAPHPSFIIIILLCCPTLDLRSFPTRRSSDLKIPMMQSTRLIFEVVIPNTDFHTANGILNRKSELANGAILYLHDTVWFDSPELPFSTRYLSCELSLPKLSEYLGDKVQLVPLLADSCTSESQARELFEQITAKGGEGVILKELTAGYSFGKRNSTLLKIKEEVTKDLLVVGMQEGEGKYSGTLGALVVQTKAGVKFEVSGMSDGERRKWWDCTEKIIGSVVEVKAMKELEGGKLREPRFKAIRWDKTVEDID